jgi:hypothetical protein
MDCFAALAMTAWGAERPRLTLAKVLADARAASLSSKSDRFLELFTRVV